MRLWPIAAAAALAAAPLISPAYAQQKIVKIDGSSTVFPVTEAVDLDDLLLRVGGGNKGCGRQCSRGGDGPKPHGISCRMWTTGRQPTQPV